eukprot:6666057-Pyramimonas_sp.AAC.1
MTSRCLAKLLEAAVGGDTLRPCRHRAAQHSERGERGERETGDGREELAPLANITQDPDFQVSYKCQLQMCDE